MTQNRNKRRERTREYQLDIEAEVLNDVATNNIEEHNFQRLVKSGVIIPCQDND